MSTKKIISSAISLCLAPLLATASPYTGKVYIDANQNGVYDKGEKTIKNVAVSDGLNVVKTSAQGEYTLPGHSKTRFLFITTPSGYKASSHYHRISDGKESYDFALQPYNAHIGNGGAHHFIQISDTEISGPTGEEEWVSDVRIYAANEQAAFIVHTGDICYEKGLKSHKPMMNTGNMDIPMYYCIGNHDLVKGKYGEELFEQIYGPVYYSFEVGNTHYIVTPMWHGDYRPSYTIEDVYNWLKNDLAQVSKDKSVVIFNHDCLTTNGRYVLSAGKGKEIDLEAHNLKAWIYGHWHINRITRHGNVLAICTSTLARGGIDHATSAFRSIRMDKNGNISSTLRYTYIDKLIELASTYNGQAPVTPEGKLPVSVNTYSTVSNTREVTYSCRIGDRIITSGTLKPKTDFNWYGETKFPDWCKGKNVTLKAVAHFTNGETAVCERYFTYSPVPSQGSPKNNWSNLAGNAQHVGISKDTLKLPLSLTWTQNVGSNIYMTSPVVYNGNVYIATTDENAENKSAVISLDGVKGTIRWTYPTRSSVKNTIAETNGILFAQDADGYLYALDAAEGKLLWEKKLNISLIPGLNDGLVASGNKVFAGSGKGLCALDAKTGELLWQNKAWSQREGTTVTLSLSPNGRTLIGGVQWGAMYANDANTGDFMWSKSENGIRNRASSPAMYNGIMYFLSQKSLFALSPESGEILFQKELPYSVDVTSTPLVTESEIIFGTSAEGLIALDRQTLKEKWRFRTEKALIYTAPYTNGQSAQIECSPILSGDAVLIGASDGVFYAIKRQNGALLWRHRTGAPILTTGAISGNMFFGADYAGNVYGFKAED